MQPSGFTVKLTVDLKKFDGEKSILEIPDVLSVRLRQHDPLDRKRQNYPAFKMPDGSVPVLEANVVLHSTEHPDWKNMTIGIPLAMLKKPAGEHEVVLNFSGVRWTMYVDGELLDNDFPFGYPQWAARNTWKLDPEYVKQAALYLPAITPEKKPAPKPNVAPVQYWTPPGHNSWVGDVATFFHQGRYHVFYLYDRRHHASKFGKGAHYFEHLSTADFKTWTEHEAATPLEEQWECIGTGTPFVFDGKFCISYGLHTGRIYPDEKTTWPAQWDYLKKQRTHRRVPTRHHARRPGGRDLLRQRGRRLELQEVVDHVPPLPEPERLYATRAANCGCWRTPGPRACGNRNRWTAAGAASVRTSRPAATARSSSAGASSITSSAASRTSGPSPPTRPTRRTKTSSPKDSTSTTA